MSSLLRCHVCIQKTASQWIKNIFIDLNKSNPKCSIITPGENYFNRTITPKIALVSNKINIVTPLYIHYDTFKNFHPSQAKKVFFVIRDPRDIIVSRYFSNKYSHAVGKYILAERKKLDMMTFREGMIYMITLMATMRAYYNSMVEWKDASKTTSDIILVKYENLIGENYRSEFQNIFDHLELSYKSSDIVDVLEKNSFKALAGRQRGEEDQKSHYRKGISGDWENYFEEIHKTLFKEFFGKQLIDLGYEKNDSW